MSALPTTRPTSTGRRSFWALALALLAIPGSTLAWDLPLGGLWIGVPLAVAAIVVGLPVRRSLAAKTAIVIAGLALLQMLVWTAVSVVS
jgi:hypothetical protein